MKKSRKKPAERKKKIIENSSESEPEFQENLNSSDEDAPSTSAKKPSRARVNLLSKVKNIRICSFKKSMFRKRERKRHQSRRRDLPRKVSPTEAAADSISSFSNSARHGH